MTASASRSRAATRQDFIDFFGRLPPVTVKARVLEVDGRIAGMAGYWVSRGHAMIFSNVADWAEIPPIRVWREALIFMRELDMPAICNAETPEAKAFLARLGWQPVDNVEDGDFFKWHS